MAPKLYQVPESTPMCAAEPAAAYKTAGYGASSCNSWNPNVPFHGTQEEWREHFHRIEEGEFMTIEEADKEFKAWKKEYLASRM